MKKTNLRRAVAGASTLALAAGLATTLGMGAASAESGNVAWTHGNTSFVRTISDVNPAAGDTVTLTTQWTRKYSEEWLHTVTNWMPSCMTYVPGTITWNNAVQNDDIITANKTDDPAKPGMGVLTTKVGTPNILFTGWKVPLNGSGSVSASYLVGKDCLRETPMTSSLWYSGSLGEGNYTDKGPAITVKADPTNPGGGTGGENPGGGSGGENPGGGNGGGENPGGGGTTGSLGSLGSIGSIFGSLS